ncbi:biopolymer transporter ExbD [Sulfurimonas sp. HSL-3221]|uniref:ExbD/TolR family protein n=1 Tax=Sulfurimonadaceae TaxID=2771471 RepID=UPI001E387E25|nr:biopolymer transporter ExbD [Sulfurimonas sp. HSL-3221]UFS62589.1 biopolymer transporter ExbD [Sulfurimonas sp. HSL-3221]
MSASAMEEDQEISEINMTPFVDIVLVILIIFMATATFVAQGKIPVTLPKSSAQAGQKEPKKPTVITIEENGRYHLNDAEVSETQLRTRLQELNATQRAVGVIVRSDAQTPFAFVVKAIDWCKSAEVSTFAIQTQQEQPR